MPGFLSAELVEEYVVIEKLHAGDVRSKGYSVKMAFDKSELGQACRNYVINSFNEHSKNGTTLSLSDLGNGNILLSGTISRVQSVIANIGMEFLAKQIVPGKALSQESKPLLPVERKCNEVFSYMYGELFINNTQVDSKVSFEINGDDITISSNDKEDRLLVIDYSSDKSAKLEPISHALSGVDITKKVTEEVRKGITEEVRDITEEVRNTTW
jgi:hypothetical protein